MKLPRGFGKNYFSLSAITATVNAVTLHQTSTRVQTIHLLGNGETKSDELEELLEEELEVDCLLQLSLKACHCNCHFLSRTRKILRSLHSPKQNLHFYALLNTDISPP
jgi:hypothetical protein